MPEEIAPFLRPMLPLSGSPAPVGTLPASAGGADRNLQDAELRNQAFNRWFYTLTGLFALVILSYLLLHFYKEHKVVEKHEVPIGYEYARLNEEQMTFVSLIYVAGKSGNEVGAGNGDCNATCKAGLVTGYLDSYYSGSLDSAQRKEMESFLKNLTDEQAITYLRGKRLRIKSYFWLTGPEVYFEIMFWAFFGVMCSVLYMLSEVRRKDAVYADTDSPTVAFDPSEKPYQVAKMIYAPITVLVIILGYNYVQGNDVQDISTSKGMLVFAFLGGFFSGRLMAFFNRLKDALLPAGSAVPATPPAPPTPEGSAAGDQPIVLQLDTDLDPQIREALQQRGLAGAVVTATNAAGQVFATRPKEDEQPTFTYLLASVPPGKYVIQAEWSGEVELDQPAGETGAGAAQPHTQPIELVSREEVQLTNSREGVAINMDLAAH